MNRLKNAARLHLHIKLTSKFMKQDFSIKFWSRETIIEAVTFEFHLCFSSSFLLSEILTRNDYMHLAFVLSRSFF